MHDIGRGLCWALDAVPFAEDRLYFVPDAWQARGMSPSARERVNSHLQEFS